jgi:hypothetical protein
MKINRSDSGKRPLLILGVSVAVLLLLIAVSFKVWSAGYSFKIEKALICRELDDNRQPLHATDSLSYGTRQVCLWISYSSARTGSRLDITWHHDGSPILSESVKLVSRDGVRVFYLLKEEGSELPKGDYTVIISTPSKVWASLNFKIDKSK